jgi:hypothetical protein
MTKHTPATPLPWNICSNGKAAKNHAFGEANCPTVVGEVYGRGYPIGRGSSPGSLRDADYIAHSANAYPRLVEALKVVTDKWHPLAVGEARDLLRDLGEL